MKYIKIKCLPSEQDQKIIEAELKKAKRIKYFEYKNKHVINVNINDIHNIRFTIPNYDSYKWLFRSS